MASTIHCSIGSYDRLGINKGGDTLHYRNVTITKSLEGLRTSSISCTEFISGDKFCKGLRKGVDAGVHVDERHLNNLEDVRSRSLSRC